MTLLGRWADALFNKHKFVRRAGIFWAWCIITYAIYATFKDPTIITAPVVSALGIVTGILATVIGLYNRDRDREDAADRRTIN